MTYQHRHRDLVQTLMRAGVMTSLLFCGPAPAGAAEAASQSSNRQPSFVGKGWVSTDSSAAPGTLRIFLADGSLVMTSCGETYRIARWRSINDRRIEWDEDGSRIEAEIVRAAADRLQLRLRLRSGVKEETYRPARVPFVCPDTRPDPGASVIRVEGTVLYLERLVLPRSARVRVELRDTSRADAPGRTLATQTIPASQGPPFQFSLSAPRAAIDPRASLSLFADIRDGERVMFVTNTRQAVPPAGISGLEVRLTFVASSRGGAARGIVTPSPSTYRCGKETFKVAFEEQRAYVTEADGSLVALSRQTAAGAAGQRHTYSNGRLTFVREFDSTGASRVLFARGRMAPGPCAPQD
jgi:uncharacterized lipoprotein YbaY